MNTDISAKFGFELREQLQALKLAFDAAGTEGQVSFIKATVRSGITQIEDVIAEVTKLTGAHAYGEVEDLIHAMMDIHWVQTLSGGLHVSGE